MQRKDQRAIKYWVKGQLNKPTTDALRLTDLAAWYAGRLLAVRGKTTTGSIVVYVEDKEKDNIDFGRPNAKMWTLHVVGRDFQKLHEIYAVLSNLKTSKGRKNVRADDIRLLAGYIDHLRKLMGTGLTGPQDDYWSFVPDGPPVRVALSMIKHRYEGLAWSDTKDVPLKAQHGISENIDNFHLLFHNFDDAVLFKLKHNGIKVMEV